MHLDAALDRVRASGAPQDQVKALGFLLNNLRAIDAQLATIESVQTSVLASNHPEKSACRRSPLAGLAISGYDCAAI